MSDHELDARCPWCAAAAPLHASTDPDDVAPTPGDCSVCWSCRGLAVFTDTGLRQPTPEEGAVMLADPRLREVLGAMAESFTVEAAVELATRQRRA